MTSLPIIHWRLYLTSPLLMDDCGDVNICLSGTCVNMRMLPLRATTTHVCVATTVSAVVSQLVSPTPRLHSHPCGCAGQWWWVDRVWWPAKHESPRRTCTTRHPTNHGAYIVRSLSCRSARSTPKMRSDRRYVTSMFWMCLVLKVFQQFVDAQIIALQTKVQPSRAAHTLRCLTPSRPIFAECFHLRHAGRSLGSSGLFVSEILLSQFSMALASYRRWFGCS